MTEEAIQLPLAFSGASLPENPLGSINRENNGRAKQTGLTGSRLS